VIRLWWHDGLLAEQRRVLDQEWYPSQVTVYLDQITVTLEGEVEVETTDLGGPMDRQLALWSAELHVWNGKATCCARSFDRPQRV
jgi:hypothetical protein